MPVELRSPLLFPSCRPLQLHGHAPRLRDGILPRSGGRGRAALAALVLWVVITDRVCADPDSGRYEELIGQEQAALARSGSASPLIVALVQQQGTDVVRYYLDTTKESGINAVDGSGVPALWHAAMGMKQDMVKLLASRNADLEFQKQKSGLTPLMVASMNGDTGTVTALLRAGAQIDRPATEAGATALALAFQSGHAETATLLLQEGARVDLSAHAWKYVVRLMLVSEKDADQDNLELIKQAVEGNESNKARFETLVWAASYSEGKTAEDEQEEDDGMWDEEEEYARLEAPGDEQREEL